MNRYYFLNEQDKFEIDDTLTELIKKCCEEVLSDRGVRKDCEISVTFTDNENIRILNREMRNIDSPTDVLSFPIMEYDENYMPIEEELSEDGMYILGDMVISLERAKQQAEEYGHSFTREVAFLCVHSMLHLLGYDHIENEQPMFSIQEDILNKMEIKR